MKNEDPRTTLQACEEFQKAVRDLWQLLSIRYFEPVVLRMEKAIHKMKARARK